MAIEGSLNHLEKFNNQKENARLITVSVGIKSRTPIS